MRKLGSVAVAAALGLFAAAATPAQADAVGDFYKGKTATIIVSTGGGTYVLIAQTIAKHMPRFIPGQPTMIAKSMPGAGHVNATNYMYNTAPRDGTFISSIGNSIPQHEVTDGKGVRFESAKFNWIGSTGISNLMTIIVSSAGVKTIADARKKEILSGGTGAGSGTVLYPTILNNLLGTKFKVIIGYRSAGDVDLAMERGEVQARHGYSYGSFERAHPDWIKTGKVNFLYQVGLSDKMGPKGVPLMLDLAENPEQKEILRFFSRTVALGRPYLAPPGVPADRVAALRAAFTAMTKDPQFVEEMKKRHLDLFPQDWKEVTENVTALINTPKPLIAKAMSVMERKGMVDCKVFSDPKNCGSGKKKKKKKKKS
jgi:tripartite-type tricarboxylate transporter receptor subunit TctC